MLDKILPILICSTCKENNLILKDELLFCNDCGTKYQVVNGIPNMIRLQLTNVSELESLRTESFNYWDGGIPGTVEGGYQKGKINAKHGTKEWFLQGDEVRSNQYKNIFNFCEYNKFSGKKILDIGPGRGQEAHNYFSAGGKVTILEYASQGVNLVSERIKLFNLDIDIIQGDAASIPLKDNEFDLVYSYGVLHHIPDMQKAIDEVYRVLKPGGIAKIMVYHKGYCYYKDMFFKWFILKGNFLRYSWDDYIKIVMEQREGPCPVVYIKSTYEILEMFKKFKLINYFNAEIVEGRLIRWGIFPKFLQKRMMNKLGAFCHLTLQKE